MKFCIDDANVEKIRRIYEYYPVDGVSTNPSILAKAGRDPFEVLKEIREIIGAVRAGHGNDRRGHGRRSAQDR